jgi:hypothetical protein
MDYMREPVENMLTSRIRQVFEEFADPGADAGWQELRKKYPVRNRRPLFIWISSAAALFLLATGLWYVNQSKPTIALKPAKQEKKLAHSEEPSRKIQEAEREKGLSPIAKTHVTEHKMFYERTRGKESYMATAEDFDSQDSARLAVVPFEETFTENMIAPDHPADIEKSKTASLVLKDMNGFRMIPIDPVKKPVYVGQINPKADQADNIELKPQVKSRNLAFSVFAGSYFNYSEGSENQLNFGAGFLSDIRLSKKLKLSTGLSLASNSLTYGTGQELPQGATASFVSADKVSSGNLTTITSYNANLLALDIPLNIKYQFLAESDKFYLSAGLTSGTYLNETYGYEYRKFNLASGTYISKTEDQKIKKQLSDFDLGRTLNLSFGLSTPFGKTQSISIEPFLKYPLGGLGSENLKFGATGINLKLRFKQAKK